jgi:hypothetical protein
METIEAALKSFQRRYARQRRKGLNQSVSGVVKCYICRSLNFRIGKIRFKNGCFITNDPELQAIIEGHRYYGPHIFGFEVD